MAKAGFPVIGVVFLVLAAINLLRGDNWIVWLILGVVFGGLGIFRSRKTGGSN
ncbi:hypothetical protein [Erythrobacter sp. 3-20A1M]|uniref:hypothetical protein n=1 Tax=Erythrobacter sp. 3-20A1M TaxID=2653850 RepID=UPI001BFCA798|nr:hypothetical protein [Erythrobacter sp. 3-20A1M]